MKFLGSGAFGEVFEGKARNINGSDGEINVAIKVRLLSFYFIHTACLKLLGTLHAGIQGL